MKKLSVRIAFLVLGSVVAVGRVGYAQVSPPSNFKLFVAASIPLNGSTALDIDIHNPNMTVALTGLAFTDTLPAGLVVTTSNFLNSTCGGTATATTGSSTISLSGGVLAAGADCFVATHVTGTTAGVKNNSVTVTSTNGGTGNTASASLTVVAPPTISKAFNPTTIPPNGTTTLTFTVTNPNAGVAFSGVAFTDTLPSGLIVATPNGLTSLCNPAAITATAGSSTITLSGSTLPPSASCTYSINVTGTTTGVKNNTSGAVSSTEGGTGNTASASLTVAPPTNTPTVTPTNTPTSTPTNTPTNTPTSTPTSTPTNTPTSTPTNTPTITPTSTPTNTPTNTPTSTPTSTPTPVPVVPTLNESGLLIFGLLIAGAGLLLILVRRR